MSGIRHVVAITFRDDTTDDTKITILDALRSLPASIPEVANYEVGYDVGRSEGNATLAIVADFASWDDYAVYRDHPAHHEVIGLIAPVVSARAAVQHERS